MIFAEGDDPRVLRAAVAWQRGGLGRALVVGREADVAEKLAAEGMADAVRELEVVSALTSPHLNAYHETLYKRLQRQGVDREDALKLARRDRHVFAALMLAHGHGDALVTGPSGHNLNDFRALAVGWSVWGAAGVTPTVTN
mgnify:CR=1 FL=1